jgi:hypothetical protein
VLPGIEKRFNELGYYFRGLAPKGGISGAFSIKDNMGRVLAEVDILLENNEVAIMIEVKTKPSEKDIPHHERRLEILRENWVSAGMKPKVLLGGIAGAIYEEKVKEATRDAGFFVIEQSGDTMKIDMPEGWTPRQF